MTRAMKALPIVSSDLHDPDTSYKGCSQVCSKGAGAQGALKGTQWCSMGTRLKGYSRSTRGVLKGYSKRRTRVQVHTGACRRQARSAERSAHNEWRMQRGTHSICKRCSELTSSPPTRRLRGCCDVPAGTAHCTPPQKAAASAVMGEPESCALAVRQHARRTLVPVSTVKAR